MHQRATEGIFQVTTNFNRIFFANLQKGRGRLFSIFPCVGQHNEMNGFLTRGSAGMAHIMSHLHCVNTSLGQVHNTANWMQDLLIQFRF